MVAEMVAEMVAQMVAAQMVADQPVPTLRGSTVPLTRL